MWDFIAKKELGNEMQVGALIDANIQYRDIYIFPANIRLAIPDLPMRPPGSLPPWKRGAAT